jgi:biotin carboxyl carrier protein
VVDYGPYSTQIHEHWALCEDWGTVTGEKSTMSATSGRRIQVTVNGRAYVVEVGDMSASPIRVSVNGHPYLVDIEDLVDTETDMAGERPVDVLPAKRQPPAPARVPVPSVPVGSQASVVRAPMPGNILDITVKPGDQISVRQQLCSLEAMKMKNAIRSPRDGVIASVEVSAGQAVAHGDVLFRFAETGE